MTSIFAERSQYLNSFNPDFHLDDSYLSIHHPPRVPSLFHRRQLQLPNVSENSPLKSDPLHWDFQNRPIRCHHWLTNKDIRRTLPKLPRQYVPNGERQRRLREAKYLEEQAAFFESPPLPPNFGGGPFVDKEPPLPPFQAMLSFLWALIITIGWLFVFLPLKIAFWSLKAIFLKLKNEYNDRGGIQWELILCMGLAILLVRWLPVFRLPTEVEQATAVSTAPEPLYTLYMRNPNQSCKDHRFCSSKLVLTVFKSGLDNSERIVVEDQDR